MVNNCEGCLEKQREIDRLLEEVERLKAKLRYQERKDQEGYFGSSTPSSQLPFKANTDQEKRNHKGGARLGHKGHGRKAHYEETADEIIPIDPGEICPDCGGVLKLKKIQDRTVIESEPVKPKKILYHLSHKECTQCHHVFRAKAPGVLPKALYGNQITAQMAVMHYFHGIPMGRICEMSGINLGSLVEMLHRLSGYFAPVIEILKEQYRLSPAKHADETGWRNDGQSGYAWLFCTPETSLFSFQNTRSASVPRSILGDKRLPGVLVVDRYNAYNKAPVQIQYCYAHLLRDVEKLEKDFPESEEVKSFVSLLASLLSQAMHLRAQPLSDKQYYREAKQIQKKIMEVNKSPAQHLATRAMQDLFNINEHRLYHWVQDRRVPPDNNLAERDLRPTVIARKVSFGSSSDAGSKTRSVLMSVLHTLNKRRADQPLESTFKTLLDDLAKNPNLQIASVFPLPKSIPRN
ncbi:IS66 family transposase [bacterium]|nr:MAG: IS66 family transposase [bacterium]